MADASSHSTDSAFSRFRNSRYSGKPLDKSRSLEQKQRPRSLSRVRKSAKSLFTKNDGQQAQIFVTIGALTETAKTRVYPSLWNLYKKGQLPKIIRFYAFARSAMSREELRERCESYMRVDEVEKEIYEEFWKLTNCYVGSYLARIDYDMLHKDLTASETNKIVTNRLYYISIPNTFMESVAQNIRTLCQTKSGWTRVIVERPFGRDVSSSTKFTLQLLSLCAEENLYRIDPYLCKDIVQNIPTIRFCNMLFSSSWNRKMIENVIISIKESSGWTGKSGKYADSYGVICDTVQLHGLQLLALTAMEKPIAMTADDIRDEKVKLLKCVAPVTLDNVVIGKYVKHPQTPDSLEPKPGVYEEPETGNNPVAPTFCTTVIRINNERWDGVPFILTCGQGLDEKKTEIRIKYQNVPADIFQTKLRRNELVIQIEPEEKLFITAVTKTDNACGNAQKEMEIPLNSESGFSYQQHPEPYDSIMVAALEGVQTHFVRTAEMKQAWRIFSPLLTRMENENIQPLKYEFGTSGPPESDRLIRKHMDIGDSPKT